MGYGYGYLGPRVFVVCTSGTNKKLSYRRGTAGASTAH